MNVKEIVDLARANHTKLPVNQQEYEYTVHTENQYYHFHNGYLYLEYEIVDSHTEIWNLQADEVLEFLKEYLTNPNPHYLGSVAQIRRYKGSGAQPVVQTKLRIYHSLKDPREPSLIISQYLLQMRDLASSKALTMDIKELTSHGVYNADTRVKSAIYLQDLYCELSSDLAIQYFRHSKEAIRKEEVY